MSLPQPPDNLTFGTALGHLAEAPEVVGALVTARDGLPVMMRMNGEMGETWSAVAAVLGNLAGQLLETTDDEMTAALFTASNHQFVVMPVAVGFLLAVATPGADSAALYERVRAVAEDVNAAATALATNQ
jgi:predicted regulator of Ras-like GTPase activity (Roadblock/LC7/MglB family)